VVLGDQMKFVIGLAISFAVGGGCRFFDIPVPSPALIPGALLVLAMTMGYSSTNRLLAGKGRVATTARLCGGPTGSSAYAPTRPGAASAPAANDLTPDAYGSPGP
jgi:XapX domain-containing protein